jgi:integrase
MPHGLDPEGNRLWAGVIGEFNLTYEPHKVRILTDACKTADLIKRLEDAAGQSAADCQGSMGQEVINIGDGVWEASVAVESRGADCLTWASPPTIMFPSTAGTWRDPNNFGRDWRRVRAELGVPEVTTHSFRKSVATLTDDRGLSARIGADQLGHARPSMTQDRYMARGKLHTQIAEALDDAISVQ